MLEYFPHKELFELFWKKEEKYDALYNLLSRLRKLLKDDTDIKLERNHNPLLTLPTNVQPGFYNRYQSKSILR